MSFAKFRESVMSSRDQSYKTLLPWLLDQLYSVKIMQRYENLHPLFKSLKCPSSMVQFIYLDTSTPAS